MSAGGRGRVRLVEIPVGVGRADQPVAAPGDDEQHALLGAQEQAELRLEPVTRHDEVDALRCTHLELAAFADHRLRVVGPHAGRVDDLARADLEVLAGLEVVRLHADDALADLDEALDPHPAATCAP